MGNHLRASSMLKSRYVIIFVDLQNWMATTQTTFCLGPISCWFLGGVEYFFFLGGRAIGRGTNLDAQQEEIQIKVGAT